MSNDSIILFGSAARGETTAESDIDILVVSRDFSHPKSQHMGRIEIQTNSRSSMMDKSRSGDLFAIHIAFEGVPISDSNNFLTKFREELTIKECYAAERQVAFALSVYLLKVHSSSSDTIRARRLAWCVRTILISNLVEQGRFVFSPKGLAEAFPEFDVTSLLSLRRNSKGTEVDRLSGMMEKLLQNFGASCYLEMELPALRKEILGLGPTTASSTMRAIEGVSPSKDY